MLAYVCWQTLWKAVIDRSERAVVRRPVSRPTLNPLSIPLPYTKHWSRTLFHRGRPRLHWKTTFLSKHVSITREEFVTFLLHKLELDPSAVNLQTVVQQLQWECFGSWSPRTAD